MRFLTRRLAVMFAAFVMLGLPEGVLGTAWPSIRVTFDRPQAALAQVLIAYTVGYLVSAMTSGRIAARLGFDRSTRSGVVLTAVGLGAYATSPTWVVTVAAACLLGLGAGIVDVVINAEVALRHGQRAMNLLHAAFGAGATLGPLAVTLLLRFEGSWRGVYGALFAIEMVILAGLVSTGRAGPGRANPDESTDYAQRARRPQLTLAATLVFFAFYVGSEISVGQWSFSILTEERGVSDTSAGVAVAAYWGGLTVGRLALGVLDRHLHPLALLRVSVVGAIAAALWLYSDVPGALLSLPALGLAFSGMFPAVVLLSSSWLGADRLTSAVGYQLAASSAGAIAASALLGLIAEKRGLEALTGAIVVLVVGLGTAHLATETAANTG